MLFSNHNIKHPQHAFQNTALVFFHRNSVGQCNKYAVGPQWLGIDELSCSRNRIDSKGGHLLSFNYLWSANPLMADSIYWVLQKNGQSKELISGGLLLIYLTSHLDNKVINQEKLQIFHSVLQLMMFLERTSSISLFHKN